MFVSHLECTECSGRADPHCLNNLIDDPGLTGLKLDLSNRLDAWMKQQGDKGAETEAIAHTRAQAEVEGGRAPKPYAERQAEIEAWSRDAGWLED